MSVGQPFVNPRRAEALRLYKKLFRVRLAIPTPKDVKLNLFLCIIGIGKKGGG